MQIKQIKESCLYISDLAQSKKFYQHTLGFELISFVADRHAFFRVGTSVLLCFLNSATQNDAHMPIHYGSGQLHIAFEVTAADYGTYMKTIANKGILIEHEHQWPGGYSSFYFRDPDGHLLEVVQQGMWEYKV